MICVPYYSGDGHTARLARAIAGGAAEVLDAVHKEVNVIDVCAMAPSDWQALDAAEAIIFGAPTFMGSTPARYDRFLEEAAEDRWLTARWRDKLAGGFTVAAHPSGDKGVTLTRMMTYAAQMGMVWVGQAEIGGPVVPSQGQINRDGAWTGVMATSAPPPADFVSDGDLETAQRYGARIAMAVKRWRAA